MLQQNMLDGIEQPPQQRQQLLSQQTPWVVQDLKPKPMSQRMGHPNPRMAAGRVGVQQGDMGFGLSDQDSLRTLLLLQQQQVENQQIIHQHLALLQQQQQQQQQRQRQQGRPLLNQGSSASQVQAAQMASLSSSLPGRRQEAALRHPLGDSIGADLRLRDDLTNEQLMQLQEALVLQQRQHLAVQRHLQQQQLHQQQQQLQQSQQWQTQLLQAAEGAAGIGAGANGLLNAQGNLDDLLLKEARQAEELMNLLHMHQQRQQALGQGRVSPEMNQSSLEHRIHQSGLDPSIKARLSTLPRTNSDVPQVLLPPLPKSSSSSLEDSKLGAEQGQATGAPQALPGVDGGAGSAGLGAEGMEDSPGALLSELLRLDSSGAGLGATELPKEGQMATSLTQALWSPLRDSPLASGSAFAMPSELMPLGAVGGVSMDVILGGVEGANTEVSSGREQAAGGTTCVPRAGAPSGAGPLGERSSEGARMAKGTGMKRAAAAQPGEGEEAGAEGLASQPLAMQGLDEANRNRNRMLWTSRSPLRGQLKRQISQALRAMGQSREELLIQVWLPTLQPDGSLMLSTKEQPYLVLEGSERLKVYRTISTNYSFPAEPQPGKPFGLPGRVFLSGQPEWTPNVQYYSSREYLRVGHAARCNIRGTLAVPVFLPLRDSRGAGPGALVPGSQAGGCLAVLEMVMLDEDVRFKQQIDSICRALQMVNLASVPAGAAAPLEFPLLSLQSNVVAEISEVLSFVCMLHNLPLAQTWVAAKPHKGLQGARRSARIVELIEAEEGQPAAPEAPAESSVGPRPAPSRPVPAPAGGAPPAGGAANAGTGGAGGASENVLDAEVPMLSTADLPSCVYDPALWGFRQACCEHMLEAGQGCPGRAILTNQPAFCEDVQRLSKQHYPLVHYARLFKLHGAVAIRVRSVHTGNTDYILEFFLPASCRGTREQQALLGMLSQSMQSCCKSLRTITDAELQAEQSKGRYRALMNSPLSGASGGPTLRMVVHSGDSDSLSSSGGSSGDSRSVKMGKQNTGTSSSGPHKKRREEDSSSGDWEASRVCASVSTPPAAASRPPLPRRADPDSSTPAGNKQEVATGTSNESAAGAAKDGGDAVAAGGGGSERGGGASADPPEGLAGAQEPEPVAAEQAREVPGAEASSVPDAEMAPSTDEDVMEILAGTGDLDALGADADGLGPLYESTSLGLIDGKDGVEVLMAMLAGNSEHGPAPSGALHVLGLGGEGEGEGVADGDSAQSAETSKEAGSDPQALPAAAAPPLESGLPKDGPQGEAPAPLAAPPVLVVKLEDEQLQEGDVGGDAGMPAEPAQQGPQSAAGGARVKPPVPPFREPKKECLETPGPSPAAARGSTRSGGDVVPQAVTAAAYGYGGGHGSSGQGGGSAFGGGRGGGRWR